MDELYMCRILERLETIKAPFVSWKVYVYFIILTGPQLRTTLLDEHRVNNSDYPPPPPPEVMLLNMLHHKAINQILNCWDSHTVYSVRRHDAESS